ncbi:MAG: DUF1287 domain-containing protein [Alphaproteobacteria bacterium]
MFSSIVQAQENASSPISWNSKIAFASQMQLGETVSYDPAYVSLAFPNGDVDRSTGVCTDVVIRSLRDAHGLDLQSLVNRDMKRNFSTYPKNWGLKRTDANIDHRRVPNLRRYFERKGFSLGVSDDPADYKAGDIVSWRLPSNLTHIGVVSIAKSPSNGNPLIVHNIGSGAQIEDVLFAFEITGHYRLKQASF